MLQRLLLAAALAVGLASHVSAQEMGQKTQLQDYRGYPVGTAQNPLVVTGGAGGGSGGSVSNPTYTTPAGVTRTRLVCTLPAYATGGNVVCTNEAGQQTTTAVAANTAGQILAANANRKTFFIQNRTSGVTVDYGYNASVSPGTGIGTDGTQTANGQGAGFGENPAHVGAYFATASAAATVVVVQGQ